MNMKWKHWNSNGNGNAKKREYELHGAEITEHNE